MNISELNIQKKISYLPYKYSYDSLLIKNNNFLK